MNDLKFAFRQMLKQPGFSAIAVLSLALRIGANTIVFSWIRSVLLDAVPGARQADRLLVLCPRHVSGRISDTMSLPDNRDLAAETNLFAGIMGSCYDAVSLRVGDAADWIWAEATTANFFDVLGVQPAFGRFFLPAEDNHPGGDSVVVLSHGLWQRRFGADSTIVGHTIQLNGSPTTVIGVMPPDTQIFLRNGSLAGKPAEIWVPFAFTEAHRQPRGRYMTAIARLKPDVTQTRVLLGKLLFKRGDLKGAASQLETALRLDPRDSSAAYQLAMVYRRQGNTIRAEELFAQIRKAKAEDLDQASARELLRIVREGSK